MKFRHAFLLPVCACSALVATVLSSACSSSSDISPEARDAGPDIVILPPPDAPAPWTPAVLRPALWLDGDNVVTVGEGVTQWSDTSGYSNDVTQPTATLRPKVTAFGGGHQAVAFEGAQTMSIADSPSLRWGKDDFAFFTVLRFTGIKDTGDYAAIIYVKAPDGGGPGLRLFASKPPSQLWMGVENDMLKSPNSGYSDGKVHVTVIRRQGSKLDLRIDSLTVGTMTATPVDISATGRNVLIGGSGSVEFLVGDIATFLGVRGAVSDESVAKVEAYLKERYKL
ncbi:hypothetical protein [Pendulispora albinea]|uniref:LamG domain-containing protein n=1 Tax=Pendulispora albinea TaxID=2741071 RepID=A0ABZ2LTZ5_9BACT